MALSPELLAEIREEVSRGFDDQLAFTRDLIAHASVRGAEHAAQHIMAEAYRERGYEVETVAIDAEELRSHPGFSPVTPDHSDALNVIGTMRGHGPRTLLLNAHIDVVPPGPREGWRHDPFEPVLEDGWLYGRGGGDMKAGLAANLFAVDALARLDQLPPMTIEQQSVVEEESTGNGTLSCFARGHDADVVLIPEPEDEMLVRANVGVLWFRVRVAGAPVHVRTAGSGANAIEAMYRVVEALRALEATWNGQRGRHRYFEDVDRPIVFNPGVIRGGDWPSSVPAWCELDARISFFPGVEASTVCREVEAAIASAMRADPALVAFPPTVEYTGFTAGGYVLEPGSEAEEVLAWAHREVNGRDLETLVTPGYLDARVFALYGATPSLVYGPIAENIHGFDERVSVESIRRTTQTLALFIARWFDRSDREAAP